MIPSDRDLMTALQDDAPPNAHAHPQARAPSHAGPSSRRGESSAWLARSGSVVHGGGNSVGSRAGSRGASLSLGRGQGALKGAGSAGSRLGSGSVTERPGAGGSAARLGSVARRPGAGSSIRQRAGSLLGVAAPPAPEGPPGSPSPGTHLMLLPAAAFVAPAYASCRRLLPLLPPLSLPGLSPVRLSAPPSALPPTAGPPSRPPRLTLPPSLPFASPPAVCPQGPSSSLCGTPRH
jgi:hypothetical protein